MDEQFMRFTKFTSEGEVISTHFYSDLGLIVSLGDIIRLRNGSYVIVYGTGANRPSDEAFKSTVLHEVTSDLSEVIASFGQKEMIYGAHEGYVAFSNASPGYVTAVGNKVIFVPDVYAGKLYLFEKSGGEWSNTAVLKNPQLDAVPFEILSSGRSRDSEANFSAVGPDGNRQNFFLKNKSYEIGSYQSNFLVHFFSVQRRGGEKQQMVEVYDLESGELLHFGKPVMSSPGNYGDVLPDPGMGPGPGFKLMNNGHLYCVSNDRSASVIRYDLEFSP